MRGTLVEATTLAIILIVIATLVESGILDSSFAKSLWRCHTHSRHCATD
jgi:hypothetical protein